MKSLFEDIRKFLELRNKCNVCVDGYNTKIGPRGPVTLSCELSGHKDTSTERLLEAIDVMAAALEQYSEQETYGKREVGDFIPVSIALTALAHVRRLSEGKGT